MAVTRPTVRAVRDLRTQVGTLADDAAASLTAAWKRAWQELARLWARAIEALADLAARVGRWPSPMEIARTAGVQQALDAADEALLRLAREVVVVVSTACRAAVRAAIAVLPSVVGSQAPASDDVASAVGRLILPDRVTQVAERAARAVTDAVAGLASDAAADLRRVLLRGVTAGDRMAERLADGLTQAFDGGLVRAVNTAHVQVLDAARAATAVVDGLASGWITGWVWWSSLSASSCPACWAMHGTVHELAEPGPLGHVACRCARVPILKPWATLGLVGDEPASLIPDARKRFNALPAADQVRVMGARRLALLRAGRIAWTDLAQCRDNPGWRAAYQSTPLRELELIAARNTR